MSAETITNFNTILVNFLKQLAPTIGNTYHHYITQLIKVNSSVVVENFILKVLPYEEDIMAKNVAFFNNDKNKEKLANDNCKDDSQKDSFLNEILRLQSIYDQVDESSRENIWQILQALTILAREYLEKKYS